MLALRTATILVTNVLKKLETEVSFTQAPVKRRLPLPMKSDYTVLPIGMKLGQGEIRICPLCKRAGLTKQINEVQFFTHSEWARVSTDGYPEIGDEECRVPPSL
jgi:hypothetical protein